MVGLDNRRLFCLCHRSVNDLEQESVDVNRPSLDDQDVLEEEKSVVRYWLSLLVRENVCAIVRQHNLAVVVCASVVDSCFYLATKVFWEESEDDR